jgi:hypothetical protein
MVELVIHAKPAAIELYTLRKNLEKLYSLKQSIAAGVEGKSCAINNVTVLSQTECGTRTLLMKEKPILNKAKNHRSRNG